MSRIDNFIGISIFCLLFNFSYAQQREIDSLKILLRQAPEFEKITINYLLASKYEKSLPDTALAYYEEGLKLAENINNDTLIAKAYNSIGNLNFISGKYNEAIDYLFRALKIFEAHRLNKSTIACLQYIGLAYNEQGMFDKAMNYSMQAMQLAQSSHDKYSTAVSMMMIGSIYYAKLDYDKALFYFQQALHKMEDAGDQQGISDALNNVALIYEKKKDFDKALEYHLRSLKMAEELKDK
ncbi:MAG TPA: tetratricopeptide repeat protein, partial [Bacteroidia bacterium]|nr:tetratricopeptide repeat protein [Bacteroidia bacterium]